MDKFAGIAVPLQRGSHWARAASRSGGTLRIRWQAVSQCRRHTTAVRSDAGAAARHASASGAKKAVPVPSSASALGLVDAVVVGGGPAGIAVVGNLLNQFSGKQRQLWADPSFQSGRVGARYREVPSNTKVDLFLQFATCLPPLKHIVDSTPGPNAATALQELPQDQGCTLNYAADLGLMLTNGLALEYSDQVQQHHGKVTAALIDKSSKIWTVSLDSGITVNTSRLVLCTGSSPISSPLPILSQISNLLQPGFANVDLDVALMPSELAKSLPRDTPTTVAVVGASHSAILVLMNLYNLASSTHPHLRVKWFTRHKELRYAKYMDGWILYDNTGLKGQAAQWARENLEEETFTKSPVSKIIAKLWTPPGQEAENTIYQAELPACTHIVQAVGYKRDQPPQLYAVEQAGAAPESLTVEHDSLSGRFFEKTLGSSADQKSPYLPGLFGAGIAFPERVTDPAGNVEYSVGLWKFMKFCRRVIPQWVASP